MSFQPGAHRRDLILVVVDLRIESAAEHPAEDGNQVDGHPAPPGGEFVEHLAGFFDGCARDLLQTGAKPAGRQDLWLHQPRGLVLRSEDPVLGAFHRQDGPARDELGEIALVLSDGGVAPLLAEFGHLGRVAGHHPRAAGIVIQDVALLTLVGVVGIPAREQPGQLGDSAAIRRRQPEHPHRHDRTVFSTGLELLDQRGQRRRRCIAGGQLQYVELRVWIAGPLPAQPIHHQLHFDRGLHGRQHQRVLRGEDSAGVCGRFGHGRPSGDWLCLTVFESDLGFVRIRLGRALRLRLLGAAFFAGVFFAGAFFGLLGGRGLLRGLLGRRLFRGLVQIDLGQLVDRPVGQRVQIELAHLGDALRQRLNGPVVDRNRREHRDVDRARIDRGGVSGGDDLRITDHDRDDRDPRRHRHDGTAPS